MISLVVTLAGGLAYGVTVSGQDAAARRELAVVTRSTPVAHPPPSTWLFELRNGVIARSPGAPAGLPVHGAMVRVAEDGVGAVDSRAVFTTGGGGALVGRAEVGGTAYLVHTERRGDTVVQAAMDLRHQAADRRRLVRALAGAEVAGLLGALLIGQVLARRAIAPLGEALVLRRRFVADASHELRSPLARLHTRAQLVARRLRQGSDVTDEVDRLVAGTGQFAEVVDDLLVSAQFEARCRGWGPVDLGVLAEELAVAEGARADALGVTIEVDRRGPGAPVVRGAESALRRVLSALLDNALGHTGVGGHVWLTLTGGPVVALTVVDDGTGLDPRDAERLFVRFVAGPRGTGLGLALVREVVRAHGGTITAGGRPGVGAVFTVRLPGTDAETL
ncbi:HAMP domain-containing sensor histidine kinase [Spirillospora sp. NPDC047279]|uniref:sensor histidine kinase n=1 Tax=Spirillospora sp. NPDC047279 TaxID=3155478 RepID=UPI0033C939B6